MKKIFSSLCFVALLATTANGQIAFAPELGLNMANMKIMSMGSTVSTSLKAGLALGPVVEISLSDITDNLYLQPGIFYLLNGCNISGGSSISINTFQMPVNLEYKLGSPGGTRFFFGAGPYLAYNISGALKSAGTTTSLIFGSDSTSDDFKHLDLGIGVNVGCQLFNNLYARIHYQSGIVNLTSGGNVSNSTKTSAIGITIGCFFGGNNAKKSTSVKKSE